MTLFSNKRLSKQFDFSSLSVQPEKFHEVSGNYLLHLHYYWCYYLSCCYWRYFDDAVGSQKVLHHFGRTFHYFPIRSIICSAQNFGIFVKNYFRCCCSFTQNFNNFTQIFSPSSVCNYWFYLHVKLHDHINLFKNSEGREKI